MTKPAIIALAAAALLAGCGGGDTPDSDGAMSEAAFESALKVRQMMANDLQPTAEVYWNSSGFVIDESGETDLTPTTEEGWNATLQSTVRMQELGELLQTPEYAEGREDDWIEFSRAMVEVAERAEQTAIDRDSDAIFEVGGIVYRVCEACHLAYPASQPEDIAPAPIQQSASEAIR